MFVFDFSIQNININLKYLSLSTKCVELYFVTYNILQQIGRTDHIFHLVLVVNILKSSSAASYVIYENAVVCTQKLHEVNRRYHCNNHS